MKKVFVLIATLSFVFLAACGNSNDDNASNSESDTEAEESLQPLEVKFETESDAFELGEEGTIKVKVTKGDENVSDAGEVQFEIWKGENQDESEKMDAENKGDGVYALKHIFKEKGMYKVISHVTARGSHTMPTKEFNVGGVEESSSHGDHHGENDLTVMLMKPEDTLKANEEVELMAHLQQDNKPFSEASVRFEYWKEGQEKHTFRDAKEKEKGKYQAQVKFDEPGNYTVKTHVKKDELHTHKEETVEVKP